MLLDCCLYPRPKSDLWTLKTHHWQMAKTMGAESRWSLLHLCYEKQHSKSVTVLPTSSANILLLQAEGVPGRTEPNTNVLSLNTAMREEFLKCRETYTPVLSTALLKTEVRSPSNMENWQTARSMNGLRVCSERIESTYKTLHFVGEDLKEPRDWKKGLRTTIV